MYTSGELLAKLFVADEIYTGNRVGHRNLLAIGIKHVTRLTG